MKALLIILLLPVFCFGQEIRIRTGVNSSEITTLHDSINTKQRTLTSGQNIKTINSQTVLGGGNLVVTATPTPEADYYLSSNGDNTNDGLTRYTPKRTLKALDTLLNASTLTTPKAGVQGGSVFTGDNNVLTRANISFVPYDRDKAGKYSLPKFIGTTVYNSGWALTGDSTYQQDVSHTINIGQSNLLNGYSWIYVIEIDTALEKTAPLTARRYLRWVGALGNVDTIPGTYYAPSSNPPTSPVMVSIHTSDGLSPNNHPRYRYEVVTKQSVINKGLTGVVYGKALSAKGLFAMDFGNGVGAIASALDSFILDQSVVMGNAIHMGVFGNYSTIKNSAYIGGDPVINGTSIVFYQAAGANETNSILNTIFLGNSRVVYTHTSGSGDNHGKLLIKNTYLFNTSTTGIATDNCDTLDIDYVYADSVYVFSNSHANICYMRNTVVRNAGFLSYQGRNTIYDNCFYRGNKNTSDQAIVLNTGSSHNVRNSIFHIKNNTAGGYAFVFPDTTVRVNAKNNIFIVDVSTYADLARANTWGGAGTGKDTFDYNTYIIVNGLPRWSVTDVTTMGGAPNTTNFTTWKTQSGQDSHSILIDLRNYEGSLKRIFIDPDNGNYNFTNSPQADSIKAIGAGMRTPISQWAGVPTREQVLDIVENDKFVLVSNLMQPRPVTSSDNTIILTRVTTTERTAITPSPGKLVWDTDLNKAYMGNGTSWNALW